MFQRMAVQILLFMTPWELRRRALQRLFGYKIHPTAKIGFSVIVADELDMARGCLIGHLNLIRAMRQVTMGPGASIGHMNWIYAVPLDVLQSELNPERQPALVIAEGGGMTSRHLVDCSATVRIERYGGLLGYRTQVITHARDLRTATMSARPVVIGHHSMVGTGCIILGGAVLPACSVLGAGSTLRSTFDEPYRIYSGVPAEEAGAVDEDMACFRDDERTSWRRARSEPVMPIPDTPRTQKLSAGNSLRHGQRLVCRLLGR